MSLARNKNNRDMTPDVTIGKIRVMFVCYGNICRSPMAEFVFRDIVEKEGLEDRISVASSGTSGEHIGDLPDRRTVKTLSDHGIACTGKRSARLLRSDFLDYDYLVGMDSMNMSYINRMCPPEHACRIGMLMDYAGGGDIADPYYTGDFEKTYRDVVRGCHGLLSAILRDHPEVKRWRQHAFSSPCMCLTHPNWTDSG